MPEMRVSLHAPTYGEEEIAAVVEVLRSGRVTMEAGDRVVAFERAFAEKFGFKHAIMVNSGSSANLLAVSALVSNGDLPHASYREERGSLYVLTPAVCWPTSVWPFMQHGYTPLIVDVDPKTWCMDAAAARRAVEDHRGGVCATVPVEVYGNATYDERLWVPNFPIVDDCCEALGTKKRIGDLVSIGKYAEVATFSFYFSHHITTLEGGLCATDDDDLADVLRIQRAHGWLRDLSDERQAEQLRRCTPRAYERDGCPTDWDERFVFVDMGYNLRPTEVAAAIGLVQLRKLDDLVKRRNDNWESFRRGLDEWREFFDFQEAAPGCEPAWFGFGMIVREEAPFTRADLRRYLESRGVETRPIIAGNIARQPGMRRYPHVVAGPLTVADRIMDRAFSIGIHQGVGMAEREYVVECFRRFIQGGERA